MKTFEEMIGLTGEQAMEARVKNVVRNTSATSRAKVEEYKQQFRNLQSQLFEHTDLGQKETTQLTVEMKDPKTWVDELYKLALQMKVIAEKVKICVDVHNRLFPQNLVEGLDEEDLEMLKEISD